MVMRRVPRWMERISSVMVLSFDQAVARSGRAGDGFQDGLGRPEGPLASFAEHQHMAAQRQDVGPVARQQHDGAALAGRPHGLREGGLAGRVEMGVGLVEQQQEGLAEERSGERDALALPAGQGPAPSPTSVS